jgi:hypothetical protein
MRRFFRRLARTFGWIEAHERVGDRVCLCGRVFKHLEGLDEHLAADDE